MVGSLLLPFGKAGKVMGVMIETDFRRRRKAERRGREDGEAEEKERGGRQRQKGSQGRERPRIMKQRRE